MRTTAKQIVWPVRGVESIAAYHDATPDTSRAYASPFAVNVRVRGTLEERRRGGSRPGMKAVEGVAAESGGRWLWPSGEPVLWPGGAEITFSSDEVVFAPDGSRVIMPHAVPRVAASKGDAPEGVTIATFYRARLFAAKGTDWFCSRMGDTADWDYGADRDDVARACAGNVALAGRKGDAITAFMPVDDSMLYIATARSLWCLSGDPCGGTIGCVSSEIGVAGAAAWCWSGSRLYFLGVDGLYGLAPGEHPVHLSGAIPALEGDLSAFMGYDPKESALHMFTAGGDWFVDLNEERPSFWPVSFGAGLRPVAIGKATLGGENVAIFRCADGAWRQFADNVPCETSSNVALGPFRISADDSTDGFLDELHATMAYASAQVSASVYTGRTAEEAVRAARNNSGTVFFYLSGGYNAVWRPRVRGAWCVIVLASAGKWAYESIFAKLKHTGRLRP